ncbi:hypothetical protein FQA47_009852 [Oryzias melastigma]|uniref:Uncharacterized protein n=1 Tax=Oryzias melastigma TaxID=30732 RepID=A0A834C5X3_ORYME|nr:hypothetical protein FQA47_009852 [Oryzias melastigma]
MLQSRTYTSGFTSGEDDLNGRLETQRESSRPPGFPAIGSFLKVTLQSGHADVAGLAVGMKPAPPPPPSIPPLFSSTHHPF